MWEGVGGSSLTVYSRVFRRSRLHRLLHSNLQKLELQTPARHGHGPTGEMAAISDSDDDIPPYSDPFSVSSDSSDRIRGNVFKGAYRVDRARGKTEDFLNDIHESYSFDLDPEYRLKLQKRFDGWGVGAKFDFKSGDCRVKVKSAPSEGEDGFRFWKIVQEGGGAAGDGDGGLYQETAVRLPQLAGHWRQGRPPTGSTLGGRSRPRSGRAPRR